MAPRKIIIDTDPGIDDVLAMLLAFSALPEELEILLLSITYGNIDVENCLQNVVSMFFHIEKEIEWRKSQGKPLGFDTLRKTKPVVAIGPEHPLADQMLMADFFHGRDGLGGIRETHPHMTPDETWKELFTKVENSDSAADQDVASELKNVHALFTASKAPAAEEILRLLRDNEPDTITIVAIGPLTNLALAAAMDPEAFLRVKEVVVMGGTLTEHGNITPVAEFNTFADAVAAARVYALSSPNPKSTMPPSPPGSHTDGTPPPYLAPYPENLTRRLAVTLFPLDITHQHDLDRGQLRGASETLVKAQSPLAEWVTAFMVPTFRQIESLQQNVSGDAVGLTLHDPLCIWYCMAAESAAEWQLVRDEDIRVETSGQWTRGMCVVDKRTRKKREDSEEGERAGDTGNWLSMRSGNRLRRCVGTPQTAGKADFGDFLLKRVFAL